MFAPGESTVLRFPVPLRNIPGQIDLLVSAFVGGDGASDTALIDVATSSDGIAFTSAGNFETATGRDPSVFPPQETAFESVKHFPIEFGATDLVTHVRLTNLAGSAEGLRLDAVEGLHPAHRRLARLRAARRALSPRQHGPLPDPREESRRSGRRRDPRAAHRAGPRSRRLEDTYVPLPALYGSGGSLICVEHCIADTTQPTRSP